MKNPLQEPDLVPGRIIAGTGAAVVLATITGVLVAYFLGGRHHNGAGAPPPSDIHGMETSPFTIEAQGLDANRRATRYLESYGWVDRQRQIIHIPIDVAFELYLGGKR